jgi:hypothetical protein
MNLSQPAEEQLVSEQPEQLIANCISFNGTITTDLIKLDETYYGFVLRGPNGEEFPLIIVKPQAGAKIEEEIGKGDKVSAVGMLIKHGKDWAINVYELVRLPTEEEIKKMN